MSGLPARLVVGAPGTRYALLPQLLGQGLSVIALDGPEGPALINTDGDFFLEDPYVDGRFGPDDQVSVNLSGGLKAKGHPVGATGVSMHALLYKQLVGEPIGLAPAKAPEIGVTLNVGGSAATNCVSVLRRER